MYNLQYKHIRIWKQRLLKKMKGTLTEICINKK